MMIVIGADTHKATHTVAAVFEGSGQLAGELTAAARRPGFAEMLDWAGRLDPERVWAIEDCRHVSRALERFLVASGERVVRVAPNLSARERGKERTARQVRPDRRQGNRPGRLGGGDRDDASRPPRRALL